MTDNDFIQVLWVENDPDVTVAYPLEAENYDLQLVSFPCWDDAKVALESDYDRWSAIILDANCVYHRGEGDNVVRFLGHALNDISALRTERGRLIPWYILSGGAETDISDSILEERMEWDADWTKESKKTFYSKNTDREHLYKRIVDHHRISHKLQIQKDYKNVFNAIEECNIGGNVSEILIDLLTPVHYPNDIKDKDYNDKFKKVRVVLEYIFQSMIKYGMLPRYGDEINLSWSSHILAGNNAKDRAGNELYKSKKRILPVILCGILKTMVNILSSDVHSNSQNEDKPNMPEYLQSVKNSTMLLKSFVFQLCDILLWYRYYLQTHRDKDENMKLWIKVEMEDDYGNNDIIDEKMVGVVERDKGYYHINRMYCLNPKIIQQNGWLGKKVRILRYDNNTNEKTKNLFPFFASNIQPIEEPENGSK